MLRMSIPARRLRIFSIARIHTQFPNNIDRLQRADADRVIREVSGHLRPREIIGFGGASVVEQV